MSLVSKLQQLSKTLGEGNVEVSVDFETGSVSINNVEFTLSEQLELVKEYSNDPTFFKLLSQINQAPQAKAIKSSVKFDGGSFKVDHDKVDELFGTNLGSSEKAVPDTISIDAIIKNKAKTSPPIPNKVSAIVDELKRERDDKVFVKLYKEVEQLRKENKKLKQKIEGRILEEDLELIDFNLADLIPSTGEISDEELQNIIDDLKGVEVPKYSFVVHRIGNVAVFKTHDDEGITYIIAEDYYFANVE